VQITYALANAYDDSPDLEMRVTDEHRARAEVMMACVESGDVTQLREAFLEVCTMHGLLVLHIALLPSIGHVARQSSTVSF
jgi:hypothetical protein